MEKQISAVEWLERRFYFTKGQLIDIDFEQAKELEKEQMIKFADEYECECTHPYKGRVMSVEQYYNETFKSE